MRIKRIAILALTISVLTACQQGAEPPAKVQSSSAIAPQAVMAKSSPAISVEPATMKSCDRIVATVHWDASKSGTSADETEIWIGSSDTDTKLFSVGGAVGEAKTGPWAGPGMHLLLKNKIDGKVLGEAIIGGPSCP